MLPDLWRMVDRRVRAQPLAHLDGGHPGNDVEAGIEHHLAADHWFHASEVFRRGEEHTREVLRSARLEAPKVLLWAHITWELCLDSALIRHAGPGRGAALRPALTADLAATAGAPAMAAADRYHFSRVVRPAEEREIFHTRLSSLMAQLGAGSFFAHYEDAPGLTRVIDRMRQRLGLVPLSEDDGLRLSGALALLLDEAEDAFCALQEERTHFLHGEATETT
ncbi:MAG TPA: hypothetical protein VH877_21295 [Polyangia bacterium]|nr:hypothetical protein [Polyangia bacterium]